VSEFCATRDFTLVLITDIVLLLEGLFQRSGRNQKGSRTCRGYRNSNLISVT
jgi:hypothetical protein